MKSCHVYLGTCPEYNPDLVYKQLQKALKILPLKKPIAGKVVIKPNLVMAHPKVATEGYTRREVIEGVLKVIADQGSAVEKTDIVEKSGLGVTTAGMYRWAGYPNLKKRYDVRLRAMEEEKQTLVALQNWKVHPHLHIAREMAERDFLIFVPKLKTNVLSHGYSGALKLNIGTIDGGERMSQHHRKLPEKIVDILEIANPDLIITDGIRFSYGGNQMTQHGIDFGLIAVSDNAVAHDMVCASLLGLDPLKIDHIKEAVSRGYGPASLDDIQIEGDFSPARGKTAVKDLNFGFQPVEKFDSPFEIISGSPYCTGGCHGIFLDWLLMIKDRKAHLLEKFPRLAVWVGKVDQKTEAGKVILVGDCAAASTHLKGKRVIRIKGCPPTHKCIVLTMMMHFGILAPLVRLDLIIDSFVLYPLKKLKGWLLNL